MRDKKRERECARVAGGVVDVGSEIHKRDEALFMRVWGNGFNTFTRETINFDCVIH